MALTVTLIPACEVVPPSFAPRPAREVEDACLGNICGKTCPQYTAVCKEDLFVDIYILKVPHVSNANLSFNPSKHLAVPVATMKYHVIAAKYALFHHKSNSPVCLQRWHPPVWQCLLFRHNFFRQAAWSYVGIQSFATSHQQHHHENTGGFCEQAMWSHWFPQHDQANI